MVVGIVTTRRDPPTVDPVVTVSPTADYGPFPGQEAQLPRLASKLPHEIAIDPARAVPLSTDPVGRALALFQVDGDDRVYVLGDDAQLRYLDGASGLGTTVLKPDGTKAAFPQRDRVTLVDLTSAAVRQVNVPGDNRRALWLGEQLLVVQDSAGRRSRRPPENGVVAVDPGSGRAVSRPYDASGLVAGLAQGAPVLDVVNRTDRWLVRTWSDSTDTNVVPAPGIPIGADSHDPAWAHGGQVAMDLRAFSNQPAPDFTDRTESVLALDANTGRTIGSLVLTAGDPIPRPSGCCAVLGWLNQRAVLIGMSAEDGHWILAWDPVTGQVFRTAQITFPGGRLSVSMVDGAYL